MFFVCFFENTQYFFIKNNIMKYLFLVLALFNFYIIQAQCDPNKNYNVEAGDSIFSVVESRVGIDIELNGIASGSAVIYEEWFVDGFKYLNNSKLTLYREGSYTAVFTVMFEDGCELKDSILIKISYPLDIPNAFSPNGDGTNDRFIIRGLSDFPNAVLSIYDVTGVKIYDKKYKDENAWDGEGFAPGNYTYILKFNKSGWSESLVGTITLFR